ncbi:MAG: P-II family nitrogen regulator [Legionellales bacterium]|nr:P-II family nitrogen regulator [Legionellales bacterium]
MKKIEAVVRRAKLEEIRQKLAEIGITGMTLVEVYGIGEQKSQRQVYRGTEFHDNYLPKIKMEIIIDDERLDDCLDIIVKTGRTGKVGDGKIIVYTIEKAIRIRSGEVDNNAL